MIIKLYACQWCNAVYYRMPDGAIALKCTSWRTYPGKAGGECGGTIKEVVQFAAENPAMNKRIRKKKEKEVDQHIAEWTAGNLTPYTEFVKFLQDMECTPRRELIPLTPR